MSQTQFHECPSDGQLAGYAGGACEPNMTAAIRAHVEQCARCTRWITEARASEDLLADVRSALDVLAQARQSSNQPLSQELPAPGPLSPQGLAGDPDQIIEGYVLEEEIGRGGMGVVYRAYQKATKRTVALKVLLEGPFASPQARRRFEREVELAAQLQHPAIITVLESGIASGRYYFAMQYVQGQRLDAYVAANKPSLRQILLLLARICEAVNYANQRGVIHRDLKPSNILIDEEGDPHVLDFGLAKSIRADTAGEEAMSLVSIPGQPLGTLAYMAPEQAGGNPGNVDVRTDVYALGVIAYQLLTGKYPYEVFGSVPDVLDNILNAEPNRPGSIDPQIDEEVDTIILKCLAKEREPRYQTAGELGRDIRHYLAHEPIDAKRDSGWYVVKKTLRRHKVPVAVIMGFAAMLAVGLIVTSALYLRAEAERRRAERQVYVSSISAASAALFANDVVTARRALDAAPAKFRRWEWRYLNAAMDQSLVAFEGHEAGVRCIALSPDNTRIASASDDHTIRIWDASSSKVLKTLLGHQDEVHCVAFSPDGRLLASASADATVRIWDAAKGEELRKLPGHKMRAWSVAFSPDNRLLASGGEQGLLAWDVWARREIWSKRDQERVRSVAFSPDGKQLASTSWNGLAVRLWDAQSGARLWEVRGGANGCPDGHNGGVSWVAFSTDGTLLASAAQDHTIRTWGVVKGELRRIFRGHSSVVRCVVFSPDGNYLASASDDMTVRTWDVKTGNEITVLRGHTRSVNSIAFTADGTQLITGSADHTVRIWEAPGEEAYGVLGRHDNAVNSIAFSPDGSFLASASEDETVRIWNIRTREVLHTLSLHSGAVYAVAFDQAGTCLGSASYDKDVRLWDARNGEALERWPHKKAVGSVALSPDGAMLAAAVDKTVCVREVSTGTILQILEGHKDAVVSVAFAPVGSCLASASYDHTVRLWDIPRGRERAVLKGHTDAVLSMAFSPKGETLASISRDRTARIWNVHDARQLCVKDAVAPSNSMAFNPDGNRLAASGLQRSISIRDTSSWQEILVLRWTSADRALAFSPDGSCLASGGHSWTVCLWDTFPYRVRYQERQASQAEKEGRYEEAERWYRMALKGRRDALGEDHPGTLYPLNGLINSLIGQERYAEAEPLAIEYHQRNQTAYGPNYRMTTNAIRLLVKLYESWPKPAEAAKWRARLPTEANSTSVRSDLGQQ